MLALCITDAGSLLHWNARKTHLLGALELGHGRGLFDHLDAELRAQFESQVAHRPEQHTLSRRVKHRRPSFITNQHKEV